MNITIENLHIHPAESTMARALFQAVIRGDDDEHEANGVTPAPVDTTLPRAYIAGPMTGMPDLNFPAFNQAAATLRASGFEVVNPAEINPDHTMEWEECMRRDIAELVRCDSIYMLPGWERSKGATLEHHIAERLGMLILD